MKKCLFAYQNVIGGFYGNIFTIDLEKPEYYKDILAQALFGADKASLESLLEDDLYFIGYYDNVTGAIDYKNEFFCHVAPLAQDVLTKKFGGVQDGCSKETA